MNTLNPSYIEEQNKIAASGAWIWLLEIAIAGTSTVLYYCNNNKNIDWPAIGGHEYSKMPISMDDITTSTSGKFPEYRLQVGDVDLSGALREHIKGRAGLVGSTVRLMIVHSKHLDLVTPAVDELAEILNCELTAAVVTFTIGIPSLLSRRFPRDKYVSGFCRHRFKGALCQYVQPDFSRTSTQIEFVPGTIPGEAVSRYDQIDCGAGRLISDVFRHSKPAGSGNGLTGAAWRWTLSKDTAFTVSGSKSNDGVFFARRYHKVGQLFVRVLREIDGGEQPFVAESAGEEITIRLGYGNCDHTLEACEFRDNTQNYGGSPGIAGGMYG